MTYSDLYRRERFKIPSALAVVIVAVASFLVTNFFLSTPRSTQAVKKNVISIDVSNMSATRANIVWRTSEKEIGLVAFGTTKQNLSNVVTDERDTLSKKSKYFNHSVLLNNLKPDSEYFYSLTNEKELLSINNTTVFNFHTAKPDNRINSLKPAYGTVISSTGSPERNTLVVLKQRGSVALTTISKNSGEWLIPLNGLLNSKSLTLSSPAATDEILIQFFDEKGNETTIKTPMQLASPVADPVRMGRNYSLPEDTEVLGTSTETIADTKSKTKPSVSEEFTMIYPVQNSVIPVGNPLIKGSATSLTTVTVTVQALRGASSSVTKTTLADSRGVWKIILSKPLAAGLYSLTARTSESNSITITRQFTVAKSGEQVLGDATGSAQLTQTPTPSPTPTLSVEPTEITPTLPSTGGSITYLMYSSAALIVLGFGLFLVF